MSREWRICKDADKFQKIASGVYSIFLIIAISLGGGWTYFTFNTELRVQNATAQLEKLNRDLAQGRLELDLEMQQIVTGSSKERILIGKLLVKNIGTGPVVLSMKDTDNPPLNLYEVGWRKGHEDLKHLVSFFPPMDKDLRLGEMIIPQGSTNQTRFSIKVSRPGLHVLVFKIPRSSIEKERAKKEGAEISDVYWRASNYIFVK